MPSTLMDDVRTVIDAMADPLRTEAEYARAAVRLLDMCDAYDALAPAPEDWRAAPEWAEWYALDSNGRAHWFEAEPYCDDDEGGCWCPQFREDGELGQMDWAGRPALPPGIDWRLCKWRRP